MIKRSTLIAAGILTSLLISHTAMASVDLTQDPAGNAITLPDSVEKIVCMSPSSTEFLLSLGLADRIIACDSYSAADYADELSADLPVFDMMAPDNEQLTALAPDLVITTGMSSAGGEDVYAALKETGICVIDIPSESSLEEVENNLLFLGAAVGEAGQAEEIVAAMKASVEEIRAIGASIPEEERKTVLYELSTPTADYPTIYSSGKNSYINEMIELIGAENVCGDLEDAWVSLTEESAVAANPDVILTTDTYTPDVVNTLLNLEGWENVSAIMEQEVYELDPNRINRPNQYLVSALAEMGALIYPDYFETVSDPFAAAESSVENAAA